MEKDLKNIALFENDPVRRVWHNEQWYFSIVDVVRVLTGSNDVKQYVKKMRSRDIELSNNWGTICTPLQILSKDGKKREENMAGLQGVFRIIQSIPSPKAEPFKQWLAKIGQERVQEIEDPELAMDRMKSLYEKKGYPKDWIEKRSRGIAVRHSLTDEWRDRGVKNSLGYAILTNEIMESAFGLIVLKKKVVSRLQNVTN